MKFADPKNDVAFKKIFGDERHKEVLISFLNAILENNEIIKSAKILKSNILSVLATTIEDKKIFLRFKNSISDSQILKKDLEEIEMIIKENNLKWSEIEYTLNCLLCDGYIPFKYNDSLVAFWSIQDKYTGRLELGYFDVFVMLDKLDKDISKCSTNQEKWIYFINNASDLELVPKELEDIKEFKTAFETANTYSWDTKELNYYDRVSLKKGDDKNALMTAERKGLQKGIEKGEKKKQIEIAKNSLKQGLDIKTVSLITGLTIDEITTLC